MHIVIVISDAQLAHTFGMNIFSDIVVIYIYVGVGGGCVSSSSIVVVSAGGLERGAWDRVACIILYSRSNMIEH